MAKSSSNIENTKVRSVELYIIKTLLKGENIIIPDIGHLELRSFDGRRTVLFKPTDKKNSFINAAPFGGEPEQKEDTEGIYSIISIPLKERNTVNLPKIGVFRPVVRDDDKIHISFTPSSSLRSMLNNTEAEKDVEIKKVTDEKIEPEEIKEAKKEPDEVKTLPELNKSIYNDVSKATVTNNVKSDTDAGIKSEPRFIRNNGITPKQNSNLADTQQNAPVNNTLVQFDDNQFERKRSRISMSWILLLIIAAIFLLVILITSYYSHQSKKLEEKTAVTIPSEMISLPALAEQHYGHSAFWIYIYEANRDKLSSPVNIPKNVSLVIPDLAALRTEYDVTDVNDSMQIKRANILADIVLKERNFNNNSGISISTSSATATGSDKGDTINNNEK